MEPLRPPRLFLANSATPSMTVRLIMLMLGLSACHRERPAFDAAKPDEYETGALARVECVRSHGTVACRGSDERGLLGRGRSGPDELAWVRIGDVADAIDVDVARNESFACLLRREGQVWCWGTNLFGVLGEQVPLFEGNMLDVDRSIARPRPVDGLPAARQLVVGSTHVCAIASAGEVYCWGLNAVGQVADPREQPRATIESPVLVKLPQRAIELYLRMDQSCAMLESTELLCWGGALPTGRPAYSPALVAREVRKVVIDERRGETCAETSARTTCWNPYPPGIYDEFHEPAIKRAPRESP